MKNFKTFSHSHSEILGKNVLFCPVPNQPPDYLSNGGKKVRPKNSSMRKTSIFPEIFCDTPCCLRQKLLSDLAFRFSGEAKKDVSTFVIWNKHKLESITAATQKF